jgi:hypothetical protein
MLEVGVCGFATAVVVCTLRQPIRGKANVNSLRTLSEIANILNEAIAVLRAMLDNRTREKEDYISVCLATTIPA